MQTPPPGAAADPGDDATASRPDAWQAPSGYPSWSAEPPPAWGAEPQSPWGAPPQPPAGTMPEPTWGPPAGQAYPPQYQAPLPPPTPVACYRHPAVAAGVGCQRCGRPICGACMVEAPVGFHCPECVAAEAARTVAQPVGRFGVRRGGNPATTSLVIIAMNVAVWLGIVLTGGSRGTLFNWLALTPTGLCETGGGYYAGMDAVRCVLAAGTWLPGVADGAYWQLVTSAFAHESVLHIGFNMVALWFLGPQVERVIGRSNFLALYLLSALTASTAVYWLSSPTSSALGASGALFGLMGALLVLAYRLGGDVRTILIWLGLNIALTVFGSASISWQGHLGGLVGGLVVTAILLAVPREKQPRGAQVGLAVMAGVLVLLVAVRTLALA